ncbi:unnamed protein product [Didymodactylos carnosus]|uniref:Uncharacterized protein n=1 Tax=Didymodactylos carnosus TaxID=1234261 RepID=A0A814AEB3_9BILA|nr:unnamed protein product [Didymodactylos carnosus]CAF0961066.1 unnamed protein product [Didymodactylos carnosus]CAF3691826.1 unnamed protein product [Didymodactylos carnosus]CAF3733924.1 unnamed protein product [Didymodactylos carnosus]
MDNADKEGFKHRTGLWERHGSPEGDETTFGYGHKLQLGETYFAKTPQTTAQIEQPLKKDPVEHAKKAKKIYDNHICAMYDANELGFISKYANERMKHMHGTALTS